MTFADTSAAFVNLSASGAFDIDINGTIVNPDPAQITGLVNITCAAGSVQTADGACGMLL